MKLYSVIRIFACVSLSCTALAGAAPTDEDVAKFLRARPELDEITWKNPARGAPLAVRILQANAQSISVEKTLASGLTVTTIPLIELGDVSFKLTPTEVSLHREPKVKSIPWLRELWERRKETLRMAGSNVGETGLALAIALRLSNDTDALQEALLILSLIEKQDSRKFRTERAQAEQLTIQFILAKESEDMSTADRLAWEITEGPENQDGMILATAFLGDRHFASLKTLEEEHPSWRDDDEILPLRQRLYHLSLDFFLYPSLFLGNREKEASIGLKRASELYQFTGSNNLFKVTLEDLVALYPDSQAAKDSALLLARLRDRELGKLAESLPPTEQEEGPEKAPIETSQTEPPPHPKRYNIFGE